MFITKNIITEMFKRFEEKKIQRKSRTFSFSPIEYLKLSVDAFQNLKKIVRVQWKKTENKNYFGFSAMNGDWSESRNCRCSNISKRKETNFFCERPKTETNKSSSDARVIKAGKIFCETTECSTSPMRILNRWENVSSRKWTCFVFYSLFKPTLKSCKVQIRTWELLFVKESRKIVSKASWKFGSELKKEIFGKNLFFCAFLPDRAINRL